MANHEEGASQITVANVALNQKVQGGDFVGLSGFPLIGHAQQEHPKSPGFIYWFEGLTSYRINQEARCSITD